WMVREGRRASAIARAGRDVESALEAADAAGAPHEAGKLRAGVTAVIGIVVLLLGGNQFVKGAIAVATAMGMSERLVGLTVVAVGTSLPELVTSVIAAKRGHSDLAVGNVVGSNIFNVFLCLGSAGLVGNIAISMRAAAIDLVALVAMTGFAALLIRRERTSSRLEGGFALGLYLLFAVLTIARD
ncbi:MAG TPA: calcium:sodium antiporter, partial [Polyangiaceae bacterium]|nr:calcium:sodium antiporter [Polyangiaceae bacterium]